MKKPIKFIAPAVVAIVLAGCAIVPSGSELDKDRKSVV